MKPETLQLLKNLGLGLGVLAVVALLLWGTWHVVRLPLFTIDQVVVRGGETISHDGVQAAVQNVLEGEYWRFVPRRFTLTYPRADVLATVTATPRVKDPVVMRDGKTLYVQFAEFQPVALWCNDDNATTSPCVFLDENGYGFAAAPPLSGGAYTRYSRVGQAASTSEAYADAADFAALRQVADLLADYAWPVTAIELDQARDAFVQLSGDSQLKITLTLTPAQTIDNLQTILTADEYTHLRPGNFAYIDLRFGNKVFVNEFGEPVDQESETAASSTESATPRTENAAGEI